MIYLKKKHFWFINDSGQKWLILRNQLCNILKIRLYANDFVFFCVYTVEILQNPKRKSTIGTMAIGCATNCGKFVCYSQKMWYKTKKPSTVSLCVCLCLYVFVCIYNAMSANFQTNFVYLNKSRNARIVTHMN